MDNLKKVLLSLADGVVFSKKKLVLSVISAFLAVVVLATSTFCWYKLQTAKGTFESSLETGNGLRMDDLGEDLQNIADRSCLVPASSVDGRNLFFPSDGTDFSSSTTSITYRSANTGDKNFSYLQYDFDLMAEANYTSIYIDLDNTYVKFCEGQTQTAEEKEQTKAIRTALFYDGIDDNKPILFNSLSQTRVTQAVSTVDRTDGSCLSTSKQTSYPFRDYSYGKKQIAILDQGEKRRFSLIIWIEGTDEKCTDDLINKSLRFSMGFTTSWDNKAKIIFKDNQNTIKSLLDADSNRTLQLIYNDSAHKINNVRFPMYYMNKDNLNRDQWYCNIPDSATHDLHFAITGSNGQAVNVGNVTYEWKKNTEDSSTLNRGDSTIYIHDGAVQATARGHWYDGDIEDKGEGHDDGGGGIIDNFDDW